MGLVSTQLYRTAMGCDGITRETRVASKALGDFEAIRWAGCSVSAPVRRRAHSQARPVSRSLTWCGVQIRRRVPVVELWVDRYLGTSW